MHELSIAEGIIQAVEKTAIAAGVSRIISVHIAVGELAGVDISALRFAWQSVTRDGLAQNANLQIERPEGRAWCLDCATTVALHRHGDPCPKCGGYHLAPTQGHELKVIDIEVQEE